MRSLILIAITSVTLSFAKCKGEFVLDGSRSHDPDGKIVWVQWRQFSGPKSVIKHPNSLVTPVSVKGTGIRAYELAGRDNDAEERRDTAIVIVVK